MKAKAVDEHAPIRPVPVPTVDELAPISSVHTKRILPSVDELAPIGDKSGTALSNRFSVFAEDEPEVKKSASSTGFEVPITEFIRPMTKRQERRMKDLIKSKLKKNRHVPLDASASIRVRSFHLCRMSTRSSRILRRPTCHGS